MLGPLRTGVDEQQAKERALGLLERFNLLRYANANPYTLSGGEKRRLTAVSALARRAARADPRRTDLRAGSQHLDADGGAHQSLRSDGVSIIVVTHDRNWLRLWTTRVVELLPENAALEWNVPGEKIWRCFRLAATGVIPVKPVNTRDERERQSSRSPFLASCSSRVPPDRRFSWRCPCY